MEGLIGIYRIILVLLVGGLAVSSLEYWAIAQCFSPEGVYSWDILRLRAGFGCLPRIRSFHEPQVRALILVQCLVLGLVLVVPLRSPLFSGLIGALVATNLILAWRRGFGGDGSDTMNGIILVTLAICVGPQSSTFVLRAGLCFLAFQGCLSYTASGAAKVFSPSWRRGEAIFRIMSTKTYGWDAAARFLEHRRWLRTGLCWSVILLEIAFPLALVLPGPGVWIFLGLGALFHLSCGLIMGFNSFAWAFGATYPAIIFVSSLIERTLPVAGLLSSSGVR